MVALKRVELVSKEWVFDFGSFSIPMKAAQAALLGCLLAFLAIDMFAQGAVLQSQNMAMTAYLLEQTKSPVQTGVSCAPVLSLEKKSVFWNCSAVDLPGYQSAQQNKNLLNFTLH